MRIHVLAFTLTMGLLWAAVMLLVGLLHYALPPYGARLLEALASVYPGYYPDGPVWQIGVGVAYGLIDGAIAGAVFGFVYNALVSRFPVGRLADTRRE